MGNFRCETRTRATGVAGKRNICTCNIIPTIPIHIYNTHKHVYRAYIIHTHTCQQNTSKMNAHGTHIHSHLNVLYIMAIVPM